MKQVKIKISGFLIFVAIALLIITISMQDTKIEKKKISYIQMNETKHLSKENYIKYARLDDRNVYEHLNLAIIKSRLIKHPLVKYVDIKYNNKEGVIINLEEKSLKSFLFIDGKQFILTESYEVLPIINEIKETNLPFITNANLNKPTKNFVSVKKESEIQLAFRMLEMMKLNNTEFHEKISEINLREGKDIILTFSDINFPVIIGRGNELKKIYYLSIIFDQLLNKSDHEIINYVDLRFEKLMFMSISDSNIESEGLGT